MLLGWVGLGRDVPLDPEKWCPGGVEGVGIRVSRRGYVGISAEDPPPVRGRSESVTEGYRRVRRVPVDPFLVSDNRLNLRYITYVSDTKT